MEGRNSPVFQVKMGPLFPENHWRDLIAADELIRSFCFAQQSWGSVRKRCMDPWQ